ncbi:MAG: cytidyltransferase [Cenarchaeum symbiont of Oopsacas minuta]|nr:cytidyltransferase [Cenarchaeum symbiont of Oopsacas minuta]
MDGLLVGRFQPFHLGHIASIKDALKLCKRLWLCIGSTNVQPSLKNPFSVQERRQMIESSLDSELLKRITVYEIPDVDDHKKWLEQLDSIVPAYEIVITKDPILEHLYSHRRENIVDISFVDRERLCGTKIREMILSNKDWRKYVPKGTTSILDKINAVDRLNKLVTKGTVQS